MGSWGVAVGFVASALLLLRLARSFLLSRRRIKQGFIRSVPWHVKFNSQTRTPAPSDPPPRETELRRGGTRARPEATTSPATLRRLRVGEEPRTLTFEPQKSPAFYVDSAEVRIDYFTTRGVTNKGTALPRFDCARRKSLAVIPTQGSLTLRFPRGRKPSLTDTLKAWCGALIGMERADRNVCVHRFDPSSTLTTRDVSDIEQRRVAVLFIHGFNTEFYDGVWSLATIADTLNSRADFFAFSWPSEKLTPIDLVLFPLGLWKYFRARETADLHARHLWPYLRTIADGGYDSIKVICHSMGNYLFGQALNSRRAHFPDEAPTVAEVRDLPVTDVLLSAPDIDRTQLSPMGSLLPASCRWTVHGSRKDVPLTVSGGGLDRKRVGRYRSKDLSRLNFNATLDFIDFADHPLGDSHNYYRDSRPVLLDLWAMILGVPAAERPFLVKEATTAGGANGTLTFWRCR